MSFIRFPVARPIGTPLVWCCLLVIVFGWGAGGNGPCRLFAQMLDETRPFRDASHRFRFPIPSQMEWDNLGPTRQWVGGVRPRRSSRFRHSTVALEPGQGTLFLVPPHEWIRIQRCSQNRGPIEELEIWVSNGSGLFHRVPVVSTSDGRSLIGVPGHSDWALAQVVLPNESACGATVAVFTSHRKKPRRLDYYQCPIPGLDCTVRIRNDLGNPTREYVRLAPFSRQALQVSGRTRIRIKARFLEV